MKKAILYLFLVTYSTVMFKPVMPYITDMIAHLLFFKDHMLTMHAHNGKFHVHTQVADGVKNDTADKNSGTLKKDVSGNDHIVFETYKFPVSPVSMKWFSCLSIPAVNAAIDHDFPPPRV